MWILRVLRDFLAWVGLIAVIAVGLAFWVGPTWCVDEGCSIQGWFSALSGWAAAVAAAATITILYKQARSGDDALNHARETAERQLRAYVSINRMELEMPGATGVLRFKNSGQTPAYKVRMGFQRIAAPPAQIVFTESPELRTGFDLGPGETQTVRVGFEGVTPLLPALQTGQHVAFINGIVIYDDVFGNEHKTHLRLNAPQAVWATGGTLEAAHDGNWSD